MPDQSDDMLLATLDRRVADTPSKTDSIVMMRAAEEIRRLRQTLATLAEGDPASEVRVIAMTLADHARTLGSVADAIYKALS